MRATSCQGRQAPGRGWTWPVAPDQNRPQDAPREDGLPRRRLRPVPPRLPRHPRPRHRAADCPRTRPTASRPCSASSSGREAGVPRHPLRPARKDLPPRDYAQYKANRPKMDDDLAVQLPYIRRVCEAFRLPIVEVPGYEADDMIATLSRQAVADGPRGRGRLRGQGPAAARDRRRVVLNPGREGSGSHALRPQGRRGRSGACRPSAWWTCSRSSATPWTTCPACPASATRARATSCASSAPSSPSSSTPDKVKRARLPRGAEEPRAPRRSSRSSS